MNQNDRTQSEAPTALERMVRRFQVSIPYGHSRKLALGFFMIDPPREWGVRCIWFEGPNYYLALGRLCFGWGFVNTPNESRKL